MLCILWRITIHNRDGCDNSNSHIQLRNRKRIPECRDDHCEIRLQTQQQQQQHLQEPQHNQKLLEDNHSVHRPQDDIPLHSTPLHKWSSILAMRRNWHRIPLTSPAFWTSFAFTPSSYLFRKLFFPCIPFFIGSQGICIFFKDFSFSPWRMSPCEFYN